MIFKNVLNVRVELRLTIILEIQAHAKDDAEAARFE